MTCTEDVAVGVFKDENNFDGFWVMNYTDPATEEDKNKIEITFKNTNKIISYEKGEKKELDAQNGKVQLELSAGEAVFLIPVCVL